ncbi:hypothetical protein Athai_09780 [Actinocatenispora thailandica]|uniref:Uncharacterized protein n=1 Tax=Actinocatenispora thailandica TaxID=227318 RepID=A0A7R7DKL2_9ACTN|nr:hypothetical protein [Actinocatenispora thailandica]BCJ33475.1 hypothetical protein Athai_09780 [Actinocatenispora thailandica]
MTGLPADGSVVVLVLTAGRPRRFRAVIVRPGKRPGTVTLRGWYLDEPSPGDRTLTVPLSCVRE